MQTCFWLRFSYILLLSMLGAPSFFNKILRDKRKRFSVVCTWSYCCLYIPLPEVVMVSNTYIVLIASNSTSFLWSDNLSRKNYVER